MIYVKKTLKNPPKVHRAEDGRRRIPHQITAMAYLGRGKQMTDDKGRGVFDDGFVRFAQSGGVDYNPG